MSEVTIPDTSRPGEALPPSVDYLVTVLEERIRSGHYRHGQWLPPERALCAEFSLGRPVIRQAIDGLEDRGLIRRSARHRPVVWGGEGAARRIDASPVRSTTRRNIGLWISGDPGDPGPNAMTRSISYALAGDDYRLILTCPRGANAREAIDSETRTLTAMAADEEIAGLLLWHLGGSANLDALRTFRASGKPLVFIDRQPPEGFEADYVGIANEYAAADAVRHLIERGHRTIAHITSPDRASAVQERLEGYRMALHEFELPFRPELVFVSDFLLKEERSVDAFWREIIEWFASLPDSPTAVFAVNDYCAFRFIRAATEAGLRVPEDVAVVGFDDSERWSHAAPFITSVSQPFEQIGAAAVRLLLERCRNGASAYRHLLLPSRLVVRGSSG